MKENAELRKANEILKDALGFFAAEHPDNDNYGVNRVRLALEQDALP